MRYDSVRLIGGRARSATWRQIMADVLGRQIVVSANGDASFGAATLAGIGIGSFGDAHDAITFCCRIVSTHEPSLDVHDRYTEFFDVYRDIQRHLFAVNHRITTSLSCRRLRPASYPVGRARIHPLDQPNR